MYEYLEVPTAVTMCLRRRSAGCTSLRTSLRSGAAAIAGCAELTDSEAVLPELDEVGERLRPVAHERAAGVGAALRIPELADAVGDVGVDSEAAKLLKVALEQSGSKSMRRSSPWDL